MRIKGYFMAKKSFVAEVTFIKSSTGRKRLWFQRAQYNKARKFYLAGSSQNICATALSLLLMVVLDFIPSSVPYMIQQRSCSLSTNDNGHFYDMVVIRLVRINVNIFTLKWIFNPKRNKFYCRFTKIKLKFREKVLISGFSIKRGKLYELCTSCLKMIFGRTD